MTARRILVTGAKGFFGSRLVARLADRHTFLATDVDTLDICDPTRVAEAFEAFSPDLVVHAAAVAATAFCDAHPDIAHRINVEGACNLARACERVGAGFVFISSEQVFNGNVEPGPYRETDRAVPDTVYGKTKLQAEAELRGILDRLWVLRFTWLFGLPERGCGMSPNVVWNAVQAVLAGRRTAERTNEFRGITHVHDLIDRFETILEQPCGTYHVGSRNDLSRYDLARHVFGALGIADRFGELVDPVEAPMRRDVRLDTGRLAALGVPFPTSVEAIDRCITDFRFTV